MREVGCLAALVTMVEAERKMQVCANLVGDIICHASQYTCFSSVKLNKYLEHVSYEPFGCAQRKSTGCEPVENKFDPTAPEYTCYCASHDGCNKVSDFNETATADAVKLFLAAGHTRASRPTTIASTATESAVMSTATTAGIVAGGVILLVVIVGLIVLVFVLKRRRERRGAFHRKKATKNEKLKKVKQKDKKKKESKASPCSKPTSRASSKLSSTPATSRPKRISSTPSRAGRTTEVKQACLSVFNHALGGEVRPYNFSSQYANDVISVILSLNPKEIRDAFFEIVAKHDTTVLNEEEMHCWDGSIGVCKDPEFGRLHDSALHYGRILAYHASLDLQLTDGRLEELAEHENKLAEDCGCTSTALVKELPFACIDSRKYKGSSPDINTKERAEGGADGADTVTITETQNTMTQQEQPATERANSRSAPIANSKSAKTTPEDRNLELARCSMGVIADRIREIVDARASPGDEQLERQLSAIFNMLRNIKTLSEPYWTETTKQVKAVIDDHCESLTKDGKDISLSPCLLAMKEHPENPWDHIGEQKKPDNEKIAAKKAAFEQAREMSRTERTERILENSKKPSKEKAVAGPEKRLLLLPMLSDKFPNGALVVSSREPHYEASGTEMAFCEKLKPLRLRAIDRYVMREGDKIEEVESHAFSLLISGTDGVDKKSGMLKEEYAEILRDQLHEAFLKPRQIVLVRDADFSHAIAAAFALMSYRLLLRKGSEAVKEINAFDLFMPLYSISGGAKLFDFKHLAKLLTMLLSVLAASCPARRVAIAAFVRNFTSDESVPERRRTGSAN